ncbi:MAG: glycerol-3-phosphate acyltransferase [Anaerolineae bacterium]|jgi:glycerol-3-phosphate acyltransferase PlsY|nr:glycerol-3-phosphate acyltransferase [Anaerolineae bacterium]
MVVNAEFGMVVVALVLSYLIGAFPTAYVVGRLKGVDIFKTGSGNMGATNVARTFGLGWGIAVWLWDSTKGIIAILLARVFLPEDIWFASAFAGVMAIVGHNWSIWATLLTRGDMQGGIRGGKGAATAFGTLLMVAPNAAIVIIPFAVCLLAVIITRYVSLGVLVLFGTSMPWMYLFSASHRDAIPVWPQLYAVLVLALILYRFRENIQRLLSGTERRLLDRSTPNADS